MATRTSFHRSQFIRLLTELSVVDAEHAREAFAEKLGQWITIADAITLRSAHSVGPAVHTDQALRPLEVLEHTLNRVRSTLQQTILPASDAPSTRSAIPQAKWGASMELAGAYEPYRRSYVAQQRDMELKLKPLRLHIREALATASPVLRQLAALDAALDGILAEREGMLLAKVPSLLEKRFKQLRQMHQERLASAGVSDNTDLWMQPGGWLARFRTEMQNLLLAELDLRLQPTLGLLEALRNERTQHA